MKVMRVTEEWQRAGVHYVRVKTMCLGFHCTLEGEFAEDTSECLYVLACDDDIPVATCRVDLLDSHTAQIERVATVHEYQGKHYGEACIKEVENWLKEKGITKIKINSRVAALGFYLKLGYKLETTETTGKGDFICIMTSKEV